MLLIISTVIGLVFAVAEIMLFEEKKRPLIFIKAVLKNIILISLTSLKIIELMPQSILNGNSVLAFSGFTKVSLIYQVCICLVLGLILLFASGIFKGIISFEKDADAKKKNVKIIKIVSAVFVFLGVFAWRATIWAQVTYGAITPDQMLINLISPTDGTSPEIIRSMIEGPVLKTLLYTFWVCVFIFASVKMIYNKNGKKITVFGSKIQKFISIILAAAIFAGGITFGIEELQLKELYYAYTVKSDIIDKNYVDPETTTLVFPEKKRNLIHIYLESMENSYASKDLGGYMDANLIPELTELSKEGISFSDRGEGQLGGPIQATGSQWSVASMVCMGTGLPMKVPMRRNGYGAKDNFLPGAYTLGDILKAQGYEQTVMFGSSAVFGGLSYYFESHGNFKIMDHNYMINNGVLPKDYKVWWGYEDAKLFEFAKDDATQLASQDEPFNLTILTVDTHFTNGWLCEDCPDTYADQYSNVLACSSKKVSEFVQWVQQQPWGKDTVIVLSGDHLCMDDNYYSDMPEGYQRKTYVNIINGAKEKPAEKRTFATIDLFPTTLSALGADIEGDRLGLGTDLYSDTETLLELKGKDYMDNQFSMHSDFYNENILYGNP